MRGTQAVRRPSLTHEESMTDESAWIAGVPLPSSAKPFVHYRVLACEPARPLVVWLCADLPWGIYRHHDQRSFICTRPGPCVACDAGLARRYVAYYPACLRDTLKPVVATVTLGAESQLQRYRESGMAIRGNLYRLSRITGRRNAAVTVTVEHGAKKPSSLPDPFDVRPSVLYVHGMQVADIARIPDLASQFTGMTSGH